MSSSNNKTMPKADLYVLTQKAAFAIFLFKKFLKKIFFCFLKNFIFGHALWLVPIILATQEAEIRRFVDERQPRKLALKTLSPNNPT
jgi:hypothetical protein